ncbi:Periplasmic dipeptide transport protein precursor [Enhygromyxa salina]|uniref:Periplasmic dipeptide transport protein n=1 Tax=Enhygromyxa salina TaxID=215803 RepID=A0A2S9XQP9_9BACT|nr:ABC transporter substrate-binding protein [Enhygromyxa salina]PRP95021.1 Periplasmic dipeptide transport protein precursor [Enhygromyxa salina]
MSRPRKTNEPDTNTLRVGLLGGWGGLDPWEAQDLAGVIVRNQCFETLYTRVDGKIVADPRYLAHELRLETIGINGMPRYSVRLVDDLFFCDGTAVQPEDIAASLQHVAPLRAVTKVNAAGGRRVQFNCVEPEVVLEPHLAQIWSVIGKRGAKNWVGTGPYAIVEETVAPAGKVLVLERNPHWNAGDRKQPSIERIEFWAYPLDADNKPTKLREALEQGEIDFTMMLSREVAKGLQGVRKVYQPGQSTAFLAFTCRRPWLRDPAVRRALSAAIDPWALARVCHDNPAAFAARGLLPPALAPTRRSLPNYGQDVAAKALEAVGDRPSSLRMLVVWGPRPYLPNPMGVAKVIAEQFGALGIGVIIQQPDTAEAFFEAVRRGEHDLILSGYIAETAEPIDFLTALLSSKRIPRRGTPMASTTNLGGYADPEMDRRLAAAQLDSAQLMAVNELFEDQRPLVPLMYGASVAVHSWRVQNFEMDPRGIPSFAELTLG